MKPSSQIASPRVLRAIKKAEESIERNGGNGEILISVFVKGNRFASAKVVASSTERIDATEITP